MIVPTYADAQSFLRMRDEGHSLHIMNDVAGSLCAYRGVQPVSVRWAVSLQQALFHPTRWLIVIPRLVVLDFCHEIGHMLSVIDRGRSGTEEDAEVFAHGMCAWLWPDRYGIDSDLSWYAAHHSVIRKVIWTTNHLKQLVGDK